MAATQIDGAGFQDLRDFIQNNWLHIAIVDTSGAEETRINIDTDSRASWTSGSNTNPLEATINLKGSDSDISLPVTIERVEFYVSSSSTNQLAHDVFKDAQLETDDDELSIQAKIRLPR